MRNYFGIGIYNPKTDANVGTLWRSAHILGASFIFTIGSRYCHQRSDTRKAWRHIPLIQFKSVEAFLGSEFEKCQPVIIEFDEHGESLVRFKHPKRAIYLLGSEDRGFPPELLDLGWPTVEIPTVANDPSYNVATAGAIVMYDRLTKEVAYA